MEIKFKELLPKLKPDLSEAVFIVNNNQYITIGISNTLISIWGINNNNAIEHFLKVFGALQIQLMIEEELLSNYNFTSEKFLKEDGSSIKYHELEILLKQKIITARNNPQKEKIIPPENFGLKGFILDYFKMSPTERNVTILSILPNKLWVDLNVTFNDVLNHADILCGRRTDLIIEIQKNTNIWIISHGLDVAKGIEKFTNKTGEFRCILSDYKIACMLEMKSEDKNKFIYQEEGYPDFIKKVEQIKNAELQILGLCILTLLPLNERAAFLDKVSMSKSYADSLQKFASAVCIPLIMRSSTPDGAIQLSSLFEKNHFFTELTDEWGLLGAISYLRNSPDEVVDFQNFVRRFSPILLK